MHLTHEQIRLFRHNGFLKLSERLPQETVEKLKAAILLDIREEVEPVVRDREGRVVRISNIVDRDSIFLETFTSPMVLDPLESLLGVNIELLKNRHNHATLRLASANEEGLHRDVLQWTRDISTIIFYLEKSTVENGCTLVIPGSHVFPTASRLHNIGQEEWLAQAGILDQTMPVPMPAGGMIVIDSMLIHGVGKNTTQGTRMSMTVGYHSVDELSGLENPKRLLVRGERIYMGNDRYK